jgi:hypothetical protein
MVILPIAMLALVFTYTVCGVSSIKRQKTLSIFRAYLHGQFILGQGPKEMAKLLTPIMARVTIMMMRITTKEKSLLV